MELGDRSHVQDIEQRRLCFRLNLFQYRPVGIAKHSRHMTTPGIASARP